MELLVLSAADVHAVLGYQECAAAMRRALAALASGQAQQPLRTIIVPEGAAGLMALMPSYLSGDDAVYGLKSICITPSNPAAGLDAHQGVVLAVGRTHRRAPSPAERVGRHRDTDRGRLGSGH